jgi:hypothetical protein
MQKMDCHNFKEMLDSYFCQELTVETNHSILSHAEHCPSCRSEMASRRNLRQALQRACAQERMSDEACERLRAMLRAEANAERTTILTGGRRGRFSRFFELKVVLPALATALILVVVGVMSYLRNPANRLPQLSDALIENAVNGHRICTAHITADSRSDGMPEKVREFDAACLGLDKIAAEGAQGLLLSSAHVCGDSNRRFAHLIYQREGPPDGQLISLLVTLRDGKAIKAGQWTPFDAAAELQESQQTGFVLDSYQTARHVVLVVSSLPKLENEKLARTLAAPVVTHLRRVENQTAFLNWPESERLGFEQIASVRGGDYR